MFYKYDPKQTHYNYDCPKCLADRGEARGCSTNTFDTDSLIDSSFS